MKAFWKHHKKLHIWFLAEVVFLTAFVVLRSNRRLMNAVADGFTTPLRRELGQLCAHTDICVMEALVIALCLFVTVYLIGGGIAVVRCHHRRQRAYSLLLGVLCIGLTIYGGFCLLWGINYYTDTFTDKTGLSAAGGTSEELYEVTCFFADRLEETTNQVPRDSNGLFYVDPAAILSKAPGVYDTVEQEFPGLAFDSPVPKAVHFSRQMSAFNFTGVYCPFTGECCLNVDCPTCLLPATTTHEMGHQRSIAQEEACNFLAVRACTTCGDPVFAYSGWLLGYIHLGNALFQTDYDRWETVWNGLPESVKTDLRTNNTYWDQFRDKPIQKASQKVYDQFLKSYGDEDGIQSYGNVVDLLIPFYKDTCPVPSE